MKITLFGTDYVGWVLAALLGDAGNDVPCIETDVAKITDLEQVITLIYRPGLESIVRLPFRSVYVTIFATIIAA